MGERGSRGRTLGSNVDGRSTAASRRDRGPGAGRAVPGRRVRGQAARRAAQARAGAALRRGLEPPAQPGQGLLRAARRRGRGAVLDVARRVRGARPRRRRAGRRSAGGGGRRAGLLPRQSHVVAVVHVRGHRPADRRRGRPARPARGAAPVAGGGGAVRAAEAAPALFAAPHDRGDHRRGRQGARRCARRAAAPRLGGAPGLGVRAGPGPPRRAGDHPRAHGSGGDRGGRGDRRRAGRRIACRPLRLLRRDAVPDRCAAAHAGDRLGRPPHRSHADR